MGAARAWCRLECFGVLCPCQATLTPSRWVCGPPCWPFDGGLSRCVCSGSFGAVYHGRNRWTGEEVAVKKLDRATIKATSIAREWTALEHLGKCPHIVEFKGSYISRAEVIFVMEMYVKRGACAHQRRGSGGGGGNLCCVLNGVLCHSTCGSQLAALIRAPTHPPVACVRCDPWKVFRSALFLVLATVGAVHTLR